MRIYAVAYRISRFLRCFSRFCSRARAFYCNSIHIYLRVSNIFIKIYFFNIEVKIFQGSRPVSALSDPLAYAVTTARGLTIIRFIENAFLTRFPPGGCLFSTHSNFYSLPIADVLHTCSFTAKTSYIIIFYY